MNAWQIIQACSIVVQAAVVVLAVRRAVVHASLAWAVIALAYIGMGVRRLTATMGSQWAIYHAADRAVLPLLISLAHLLGLLILGRQARMARRQVDDLVGELRGMRREAEAPRDE